MILGEGHSLLPLEDDEYLVGHYFGNGLYVPEIKKMELEQENYSELRPDKCSDNTMLKKCDMVNKISWKDFKDSGMLWWINMILHTFGLAIVFDMEDGEVKEVYPARVKYRGFGEKNNTEGYIKVSKYLNDNSDELLKEAEE